MTQMYLQVVFAKAVHHDLKTNFHGFHACFCLRNMTRLICLIGFSLGRRIKFWLFMIHELYDIDRPERHLVATEKEVAKSNLTISKLDVFFAILVSGKLHAFVQQDLKQGRGQIGI